MAATSTSVSPAYASAKDPIDIRYTLDGSEPVATSPLYTGPVSAAGVKQVRARLFYGPAASVTSILYVD